MTKELVERALEIARKRQQILDQMRQAVRMGDKEAVFELACKLTGVTNEERHRTHTRVN